MDADTSRKLRLGFQVLVTSLVLVAVATLESASGATEPLQIDQQLGAVQPPSTPASGLGETTTCGTVGGEAADKPLELAQATVTCPCEPDEEGEEGQCDTCADLQFQSCQSDCDNLAAIHPIEASACVQRCQLLKLACQQTCGN